MGVVKQKLKVSANRFNKVKNVKYNVAIVSKNTVNEVLWDNIDGFLTVKMHGWVIQHLFYIDQVIEDIDVIEYNVILSKYSVDSSRFSNVCNQLFQVIEHLPGDLFYGSYVTLGTSTL